MRSVWTVPVSALPPPAIGVRDDEPAGEYVGGKQRHGRGGELSVETSGVEQTPGENGDFDDDGDPEDPPHHSELSDAEPVAPARARLGMPCGYGPPCCVRASHPPIVTQMRPQF